MRFKYFIQLSEEGGGSDNGMMGFNITSSTRKPSDGQPFKNNGPVAGQTPRGATGGASSGMGGGMGMGAKPFMKKKMKKMKKS
jgi:hypothetical protein